MTRITVAFSLHMAIVISLCSTMGANKTQKTYSSNSSNTTSYLIENMDSSANPCDDFYQYACGGFIKNNPVPANKTGMTVFGILQDKLNEQLRALFEEQSSSNSTQPSSNSTQSSSNSTQSYSNSTQSSSNSSGNEEESKQHFAMLVKDLYKSCMNESQIEAIGLKQMKDNLADFGGWPVVEGDKYNESNFTWNETVFTSRRKGYIVSNFISFGVSTDLQNSSRRIIYVGQPVLGMSSREQLLRGSQDKTVQAYLKYQVEMAVLLGADRNRSEKELNQSLQFEIQLANISLPPEKMLNATALYNPMTISELQKKYPSIHWLKYLQTVLATNAQIDENEVVIVNMPTYLAEFEKLIVNTSKRVQANYAMWRVVSTSASYLSKDARNAYLNYFSVLTGQTASPPRWQDCITQVSLNLPVAVGALYVRHYFPETARQGVREIVSDVMAEFELNLDNLTWMDQETLSKAKEKAKKMTTHTAYPDELLDNNKLNDLYKNWTVGPDQYLQNILNLIISTSDYIYGKLREPVNKTDWVAHGGVAVVNAQYNYRENSLQLLAGVLQGPYFSSDRPRAVNYGSIGWMTGTEITTGFDSQGSQYDSNGNVVNWWQNSTKTKYLEKAQCIIDQYGNYTVPEADNKTINGITTLGQNIAENGGILIAYRARQKWVTKNGNETLPPGLNMTQEQLFWLSAANLYCSSYRPETIKLLMASDIHSPDQFRVKGSFSNSEQFAIDWSCGAQTKMNPSKKCRVW